MDDRMTREDCLLLLRTKATQIDRLPNKADFNEIEVARIKSFFGPWPRALEAAGLKPSTTEARMEKNCEKRIRAKRRRTAYLKELRDNKKSVPEK